MNRRIQLFFFSLFFAYYSFAQKINKDFIDGEIYLKVNKKPVGALTATVNFERELPFLKDFSAEFVQTKMNRAFFTAGSEKLQKIYRLTVKKPEKIDALIDFLKQNPEVEYVEKVPFRTIIATPNDSIVGSQWALTKIKAFEAWDVDAGEKNIVVAVVDNAIQTNHVDLQANMLPGRDLSDNDNDPNPPNTSFSHGTHVAGILSAVSNNRVGIASASNNQIKILPVKATPDAGSAQGIYNGFEGITWAADNGAQIISLSWGGAGYSQAEQEVIDYVHSKGIVIVAAAGNDNSNLESFPAAYAHVISVASLDSDDKRSSFSTYGSWVDISAPGRGILSTVPTNGYASFNGTSMATPLVASVLGYIWSCSPSLTPAELEGVLVNTADNIDAANPTQVGLLGAGRINLSKAVACSTQGILSATITANSSTYLCEGESVTLLANTGLGLSYQWRINGQATTNVAGSLVVSTANDYQVIISKQQCAINSGTVKVRNNPLVTTAPSVTNKETSYCTPLTITNGLKANAVDCNYAGPITFTYNGPIVGYDGFSKNENDPSVSATGLSGLITSVKVSITWEKKDQGDANSCGVADGGGKPYNEEVSFKLKSPSGTVITLIDANTYASGTTTSGMVTTVFEDGASPILLNSIPLSGTFAPNQSLSAFINEVPTGAWMLLAEDNGFLDPLCVKNFSITVTTNSPALPPTLTWWDSSTGGALLGSGAEYLALTTKVGVQTYYVQSRCEGLCPSARTPVTLTVRPLPEVYVFPISLNLANDSTFNNFLKGSPLRVIKDINNQYILVDSTTVGRVVIGNTPPLKSPVALCSTKTYLLLATGCPTNNISWSNGKKDQAFLTTPSSSINYSATCTDFVATCTPIASSTVAFVSPLTNVLITAKIYANSVQTFTGMTITASNEIETPAQIQYRANKAILLNPGFSASGNSVFTAQAGTGCDN